MARIGLIQTRGIGDIIIALPIAARFHERGDSVFWPVDARYVGFLERAAPFVQFIPVQFPPYVSELDYFITIPRRELRARGCQETFVLYSSLKGFDSEIQDLQIAQHLKFDEYKYAIAGVPFKEKWNLKLVRDEEREERLYRLLAPSRPFICMHLKASTYHLQVNLPPDWRKSHDIIEIDEQTDSPFDWLLTLERAAKIFCIESLFSNLVDQLNLPNEKHLVLRVPGLATPVLKNGWHLHALPS